MSSGAGQGFSGIAVDVDHNPYLAEGAGAAARQAMGLVIFTGLIVGTIFTLFVVPMFYTLISRSDSSYALHRRDVEKTFGTH